MEWVKAFHIISIIAWMAGLLYLPRLFVYHAEAVVGSDKSETFKIMERRLYRAIMTPAMVSSWIFGLWLVFGLDVLNQAQGWVYLKGLLIVTLSVLHFVLGEQVKRFSRDENLRPGRYFRILNEVPTLVMIAIVILVVVKPF
jgi:protoporphyrinogen IX oxidase